MTTLPIEQLKPTKVAGKGEDELFLFTLVIYMYVSFVVI